MSTLKVDTLQTTGGAGLYPAKAWVNFNGTSTVSIRADGNVSSITDRATGRYDVNLSAAVSDANSAVSGTVQGTAGSNYGWLLTYPDNTDFSTTHFPVRSNYNGVAAVDPTYMTVKITR